MIDLTDMPSVVAAFRQHVTATPDKEAVTFVTDPEHPDGAHAWSYHRLDHQARTLAAWLQRNCPAGSRVLLLHPAGLAFVAAFLGCLYAGMIAVPSPLPGQYRHQRTRVRLIARDAGVAVILTDGDSLKDIGEWQIAEGLDGIDCVASDLPGLADPDTWTDPHLAPDDTALLQYTSGSTGAAKGVMVTHRNVLHNVTSYLASVRWSADDRCGSWIPHFHDMGLSGLLLPTLLAGSSYYLMAPITFIRRPLKWLKMIERFGIAMSAAPDFAYDLCVRKVTDEQVAQLDLTRWRFAANGSEPIHASVLAAFAKRFADAGFPEDALAPCYGLAEATVYVSGRAYRRPMVCSVDAASLERRRFVPARPGATARHVVCCGTISDLEVHIVEPVSHAPLPPGQVGEIWLRGPSISPGYWQRPDATRETFGGVTADGDVGWLRTGDLGALHQGELYVTGRIKELLIVRGRNLYPQDIEGELRLAHPELGAVGAVFTAPPTRGAPTEEPEEQLIVTHEVRGVPQDRLPALADAIRMTVSREFGAQVHGVLLVRPGTVRRTTSGKVQRSEMRRLFMTGAIVAVYADQQ